MAIARSGRDGRLLASRLEGKTKSVVRQRRHGIVPFSDARADRRRAKVIDGNRPTTDIRGDAPVIKGKVFGTMLMSARLLRPETGDYA
jgi:hypothetical protein